MTTLPITRAASGRLSPLTADVLISVLSIAFTLLPGGALASFLLLAYNIVVRRRVFQSLIVTVLIVQMNPVLFSVGEFSSLRWVLLIIAAVTTLVRFRSSVATGLLIFVPFFVYVLLHSLMYSVYPDLSITKIGVMAIGLYTITLVKDPGDVSPDWTLIVISALTLLSAPTLVVRSIGFAVNGSGFQGLLSQPQAFGITSAIFLLATVHLSHHIQARWRPAVMVVSGLLLVYVVLSGARTAMFAVIIAFTLREVTRLRRRFSMRRIILLVTAALGVSLGYSTLADRVEATILKRSGEGSLVDAAIASRGGLVERSLQNIEEAPWRGIGFGVPSDLSDKQFTREPVFNLPISAPIEKGVIVTAVVEELGYLGGALLLLTLTVLMVWFTRRGSLDATFMALLFFVINFGEMIMFSFGALGLLGWAMVFAQYRFSTQGSRASAGAFTPMLPLSTANAPAPSPSEL